MHDGVCERGGQDAWGRGNGGASGVEVLLLCALRGGFFGEEVAEEGGLRDEVVEMELLQNIGCVSCWQKGRTSEFTLLVMHVGREADRAGSRSVAWRRRPARPSCS